MLKRNRTCNRMGQNKKVKSIQGETEIMAKNYFFEKNSGIMAQISYVPITRGKKDIHYEQCVKL